VSDPIALETVTAVVADLAVDRATLLVGDAGEPWDFPMEMLPAGVEPGSFLLIEMSNGRPVGVELHREHEELARRGVDHRLARLARIEHLTGHEVRVS
jgi:hypothetical protein